MCGVFGVSRARPRRRAAHVLRPLRAPAPRPGVGGHRRLRGRPAHRAARPRARRAGLRRAEALRACTASVAIGHTRYSTTGSIAWANAQPLLHHGRSRTVALGHNGNLVNAEALRDELAAPASSSADLRQRGDRGADRERRARRSPRRPRTRCGGSRARSRSSALADGTLVRVPRPARLPAARARQDRRRPASSPPRRCALDLVGADVRARGRARRARSSPTRTASSRAGARARERRRALHLRVLLPRPARHAASTASRCTARACDGRAARGRGAGRRRPRPADPRLRHRRPRSASRARSGIPFSEGLIKNRYVAAHVHPARAGAARAGHPDEVQPARRGRRQARSSSSTTRSCAATTTEQIVHMLFDAGAPRCTCASPRRRSSAPCFYGIDLADRATR